MSLYGKACASLITLLADYQIGPFFKTLLVMFLDESSIVAYFATQHAHYLSTLIANVFVSSPGFSTQGVVLGMASHKLGKVSGFRSAIYVKTLLEQKCLQKNKSFVSIRLLYPLNIHVDGSASSCWEFSLKKSLVTAKTTLFAGGGQSSLRTRVTLVNFLHGGACALYRYGGAPPPQN